jgi:hypothetical protein
MSIDTANSLLTLTSLKRYLGEATTSTSDDAFYEDVINAVSHTFNSRTGRLIKSREHTTYHDGNGKQVLHLDQYPIVSAATGIDIRIDTDWDFSTSDKVTSTDIRIYKNEGKVFIDDDSFESGEQSVKVVYTAGYTVSSTSSGSTQGTLPGDLDYAAKEMAQMFIARRGRGGAGVGVRTQSYEGATLTYEEGIPWSVRQVLDMYRDRRFG